jgi:hypothetical protein
MKKISVCLGIAVLAASTLAQAAMFKLAVKTAGIDKYSFVLESGDSGVINTVGCTEIAIFNREVTVNPASHYIIFNDTLKGCKYSNIVFDK